MTRELLSLVSAFNLPRAVIEVAWKTGSINSATSWRPSDPSGLRAIHSDSGTPVAFALFGAGQLARPPQGNPPSFRWSANDLIDLQRPKLCSAPEEKRQCPAHWSSETSANSNKSLFLSGQEFSLKGHSLQGSFLVGLPFLSAKLSFAQKCVSSVSPLI